MPLRSVLLRPWHVAATLLVAVALLLTQAHRVEAAVSLTFTLNNTAANANTDANLTISLDADLNLTETIVLTFPTGWVVQDGALTTGGSGIDVAGFTMAPTVTGNAAARTVTFTMNGIQTSLAPINVTINPSAQIVNASSGTNVTVTVAATGQGSSASAAFSITGGGGAITGGAVTLGSSTVGANTSGTIAFTLGAALATSDSIVLTFPEIGRAHV